MERSNEWEMVFLGQEIRIRNSLTYKEMVECAEEYISRAVVLHPVGVACWSHMKNTVLAYILLKHLTNADMSAYETEDGLMELADRMMEDDAEFEWQTAVNDLTQKIVSIANAMFDNVKLVYEKECSLENKLKESFGFLFEGGDLTETLAKSREINEQMIENLGLIAHAKQTMMEKQAPVDLAQFAKRKK